MPKKSVNVFLRGGGGTPTLSPLGEYYFPPKLLTAAAMRSYVKLRSPLVRFAVSHIAHAALTMTLHYFKVIRGAAEPFGRGVIAQLRVS